jgi:prepilin-type N-terminal cleavage/methylation domain-containing protein
MSGKYKLSRRDRERSAQRLRLEPGLTRGFTLVELLVTIAIIGTLIAVLLPAVQAGRESARRSACVNNLRQLGIAAQQHSVAYKHYPTGGWGDGWTGDPDRGYRREQPGGWVYNILPFIEESSLHDKGSGLSALQKKAAAAEVIATPLAVFNCPTRRPSRPYPNTQPRQDYNTDTPEVVARADYAANCGDRGQNVLNDTGGPSTLAEGKSYPWPNRRLYSGICFVRSEVSEASITDCKSKTYLIGEQYHNPDVYFTGTDVSDRGHMYVGHGAETLRIAMDIAPPRQDYPRSDHTLFGSAHVGTFHMAYCDGSVHHVSYNIDPVMFQRFGNRSDNEIAIDSD